MYTIIEFIQCNFTHIYKYATLTYFAPYPSWELINF